MNKLLVICSLVFSITLFAQSGENKDTPVSDTTISQQENIFDSMIDYLNNQDWTYLRVKEDLKIAQHESSHLKSSIFNTRTI